ncbi:MAG: iron-containing alcohol dehydrogenase family protein [Candidatus Binatia bacterium]
MRIGRNLLDSLPDLLLEHNLHFRSVLVVASRRSRELAGNRVARSLGAGSCLIAGDNSMQSANAVRREVRERRADLLVGVGGGTPLDVAKFVAAGERVSFLSIPTTPSNDGIASPVAVIRNGDRPESLPARMPIGVVADLDVVRESPGECIRAGIGDLLSNLSAVTDWELACRRGKDRMDDFARLLALTGAEAILRHGDGERSVEPASSDLLEILINGLVLSGVAMEIAGSSRPCSGAEHLFSHAVDRIASRPGMHGAQVGLGTLLMSVLRGEDWQSLRTSMRRLGAPISAREAGIRDDDVIEGLLHARETRPERYTLLDEISLTPKTARDAAKTAGIVGPT